MKKSVAEWSSIGNRALRSQLPTVMLLNVLLGLSACDHQARQRVAMPDSIAPPSVNAASTVTSVEEPTTAAAPPLDAPQPDTSRPPLDLTYQASESQLLQEVEPIDEGRLQATRLKDMFAREKEAGKLSVSGGIMRDGSEPELTDIGGLVDSIDGAEVSFQLKTR